MNDASIEILLVEDDEVDVMTVRRAFEAQGLAGPQHVARDGQEALDMLRGADGIPALDPFPRIVLLDLNLPRMGGLEFLRAIRADPRLRSLSVFVLTSSDLESDRDEAWDLNVAGYVVKPVDFEAFVEMVGTLKAFWELCEHPRGS